MTAPWDEYSHMCVGWFNIWRKSPYTLIWKADYKSGSLPASDVTFLVSRFPTMLPYSGWKVERQ